MNVLFLNAGRRNELIVCFRQALRRMRQSGKLIASDIQPYAPALYQADARVLLPRSRDPGFVAALCELCRRRRIRLIVPLIDPDLPVLARHRQAIEQTGARLLVSDEKAVAICRDKCATADFLIRHGFPAPRVFTPAQALRAPLPLFVKPRDGSAGLHAFRVDTRAQLRFFMNYVERPVVQEYIAGDEVTTDVFSDWDGRPLLAVPRRRLRVRAGEVSVGRVERHPALEELCRNVAQALGTVGMINVQAFVAGERLVVSEINPRFGGGCPLSMRAGAPFAAWAVMLALGRPLPRRAPRLRDGLTMLRFDEAFYFDRRRLREAPSG